MENIQSESVISVIVPVYRVEPYLRTCVDSILNQTFRSLEIILVDDGSDDGCPDLCDKYAAFDHRIRVIHKENGGLSDARNAGLDIASGDYIGFVDSDDWIDPSMYENLLSAAERSGAAAACCDYACIDDVTGRILEKKAFGGKRCTTGIEAVREIMCNHDNIVVWNKLYRSELFQHVRFPSGEYHEDNAVFCRTLGSAETVVFTGTLGYYYRLRQNGIMQSGAAKKHFQGLETARKEIEKYVSRSHPELEPAFVCYDTSAAVLKLKYFLREGKRENAGIIRSLTKTVRHNLRAYTSNPAVPKNKKRDAVLLSIEAYMAVRRLWHVYISLCKKAERLDPVLTRLEEILRYPSYAKNSRAILFNTPRHGNLGDHAIAAAEMQLLSELEIPTVDFPWLSRCLHLLAALTPRDRLILISGGGCMGSLWANEERKIRRILRAFRNHSIVIFPQTVWFDLTSEKEKAFFEQSRRIYSEHPSLTLFVREQYSYDFIKKEIPSVTVKLVPDMAMLLESRHGQLRDGVLLCLRNDREKKLEKEEERKLRGLLSRSCSRIRITDTVADRGIDPGKRAAELKKKLSEFSDSELVVTDRLHGMIFAAITETPCIVLNSRSYKLRGCYEWLRALDYIRFAGTTEELPAIIDELKQCHPVYNRDSIEKSMTLLKQELLKRVQE